MIRCTGCGARAPEGSRFCPSCAASLVVEDSEAATRTSMPSRADAAASPPVSAGRSKGLDSLDASRFIPGTVLAGRYRIIGLAGRGGMGEVYRADDLKLGQPVALKFLPEELERDDDRLARFLQEVKLARQIAHPNVCRVYDVGEVDGHHFISMEFVDGENLAALLKQIGRLPRDKAAQIARQLCAGLAAAHEQGILHRDLKPANVMLDGRGRARITDFGLADFAERIEGEEIRAGTPAYMAPEQVAGRQVTVQSDLYALGLVFYELFTGKRAFEARSAAELMRLQLETSPTSPSSLVDSFDPAVERAIEKCLEKDPSDRPSSALAVAAALPGGDPLAAALAAGETPSPEMVAAAGPRGGLAPPAAMAWLAATVLALAACFVVHPLASLHGIVPLEKSFEVLKNDAEEAARTLGYTESPASRHARFTLDTQETLLAGRGSEPGVDVSSLSMQGQRAVGLFYRQSPDPLVPSNFLLQVASEDPAHGPGDVTVRLTLDGDLTYFRATPARRPVAADAAGDPPRGEGDRSTDWAAVFEAAGLDIDAFETEAPAFHPPDFADERAAWSGALADYGDRPVRIEAAALGGRPVLFRTVISSSSDWSEEGDEARPEEAIGTVVGVIVIGVLLLLAVGALVLVARNLRLGRGDRRGAVRLAAVMAAARLATWVLTGHHVGSLGELYMLLVALSQAVMLGLLVWVFYIALEPYARRAWPQLLVSWNRLLAGRVRDPLVGRDVLIGAAVGLAFHAVLSAVFLTAMRAGISGPVPESAVFRAMHGGRFALGVVTGGVGDALVGTLGLFTFFVLLRIIARRTWIAVAAFMTIYTVFLALNFTALSSHAAAPLVGAGMGLLIGATLSTVLIRLGLVALLSWSFATSLVASFPVTYDVSAPFFATALLGPILVAALAAFAFHVSLGGRPIFKEEAVERALPARP